MELVGVHGRSLRVAFHRRRRRLIPGLSAATAISAAAVLLIFLLAIMSLLSPPLLDHPSFPGPGGYSRSVRRYPSRVLVTSRV